MPHSHLCSSKWNLVPTIVIFAFVGLCSWGCGGSGTQQPYRPDPALLDGEFNYWRLQLRFGESKKMACERILGMGPIAKHAVPDLALLLDLGTSPSSDFVAIALGRIGPPAKAAVPALIRYKNRNNDLDAVAAVNFALWRITNDEWAFAELMRRYKKKDVKHRPRSHVLEMLGHLPTKQEQAIDILLQNRKLQGAIPGLIRIGLPTLPKLSPLFSNKQSDVRIWALGIATFAAMEADKAPPQLVEALVAEVENGQGIGDQSAVFLGFLGPKAKDAIPSLRRVRTGRLTREKIGAYFALWKIANDRAALSSLLAACKHKYNPVRGLALELATYLDPNAPGVQTFVKQNVRMPPKYTGNFYGRNTPTLVPMLTALLQRPNYLLRRGAAHRLANIGPAAKDALPVLVKMIKNPKEPSWEVAGAISGLRMEANSAVPELIDVMNWQDQHDKPNYAVFFGSIGPSARLALPEILGMVKRKSTRNRSRLLRAMCCIDPYDPRVIAAVHWALDHKSEKVQRTAIDLAALMQSRAK